MLIKDSEINVHIDTDSDTERAIDFDLNRDR